MSTAPKIGPWKRPLIEWDLPTREAFETLRNALLDCYTEDEAAAFEFEGQWAKKRLREINRIVNTAIDKCREVGPK